MTAGVFKKAGTFFTAIAAAAMIFTGCGSTSGGTSSSSSASKAASSADAQSTTESGSSTQTAKNGSAASGSGKTLVVYYSASGNTKKVAEEIASAAGADTFEIVPQEVYTDEDLNWNDDSSRVSKEHNDESLRDVALVSTEVPDWDSYNTVLIGYPIWWGIAAWPTDGFVKANDFTGKTVIPFCTSSSSGIGDSGKQLQQLAGTGNWQDGQRFASNASSDEIDKWVQSLGLAK